MKVIEVPRKDIPADFTDEHTATFWRRGHKRGVFSTQHRRGSRKEKVVNRVLGFASDCGVGLTVFGGLTFVGLGGKVGNGPVRFRIID